MVVKHAVGQERIEVPALDQPRTGFRMGNVQRALLKSAEIFVIPRHEIQGVLFGGCCQQGQSTDIMQQSGKVGFLNVRVTHSPRNLTGQNGGG